MRKSVIFFFLFAILPLISHAAAYTPLAEALKKGLIEVSIVSLGGHSKQCVQVQVTRIGSTPCKISIPAGHVFEPADSSTQNIIVVREELFTLSRPKMTLEVWGLCAEPSDASPTAKEAFLPGKMAGGVLQKMAEYLSKSGLYIESDAQTAIWAMVDSMHTPGIGHKGLLSAACQILGKPLPEYSIKRLKSRSSPTPVPATPRRVPAYVPEPMQVEGRFQYESQKDVIVSAFLQDSSGQKIKTFFEAQKQSTGIKATYHFEYKTTKLKPGTYTVVFYVDDRPAKKIIVRY
jgi:hypothetical protein